MSSADEATRGQPEERLGLSPMESEICHLHRAASTRGKNDHPERHQLSQAHPIPFWDGDLWPADQRGRNLRTVLSSEQLRKRGDGVPQFDGRLQPFDRLGTLLGRPCVITGELGLMVEALLTSIFA